MNKIIISIIFSIMTISCTDATRSSIGSFGNPAMVKCYSGGKIIYDGESSGRVSSTEYSDGWEFRDKKSGKFIRVSGDCVVEN